MLILGWGRRLQHYGQRNLPFDTMRDACRLQHSFVRVVSLVGNEKVVKQTSIL